VLLLLHREGEEYPNSYERGPYKYLATPLRRCCWPNHTNE
jgi:hypothetical protein